MAIRVTSPVMSAAVRGRPGPRFALPSYLLAINLRCQANSVWGVTIVATSLSNSPTKFLGLRCQSTTLLIAETHSAIAKLLSENSVFLHQILDDMLLMLVHPTAQGDDKKGKRVEESVHCRTLSRRLPCLSHSMLSGRLSFYTVRGRLSRMMMTIACRNRVKMSRMAGWYQSQEALQFRELAEFATHTTLSHRVI